MKGKNGTTTINALGVNEIGSPFPSIDMSNACTELGVCIDEIHYPSNRNLDILVGTDNAKLSLTTLKSVNDLVLAENMFG